MVTPTGCTTTLTHTINISQATITSVASLPSCPGGTSGSATVFVAGSNNGYTYTWTAPGNSVVSNASTAVNLAPGIYTVQVQGISCGPPTSATVQVNAVPPMVKNITKPYCGNLAIITASPGTGYQWYNGTTPVPPPAGTSNSIVINNPCNNCVWVVTYTTTGGCKDSVRYTLQSIPPGNVNAYSISPICTGASNGTGAIVFVPAAGSPPNQNTVAVLGPNNYSFTAGPTGNTINISNLGAGVYTINGFDGSCFYNQQFTVTPFTFNYTVSPQTATICEGNTFSANITMNYMIGSPCSTISSGPPCSSPNLNILGTQNGLSTSFSWPAPFGNLYYNTRQQFIVQASELTALGMGMGYITSIGFNVTQIVGGNLTYQNYSVRIKCTTSNAVGSTFDNTGLMLVYQGNYSPVVGWNQLNFTNAFYWDGTSNILIDICYNSGNNWSQYCVSPWQTTTFNSFLYYTSWFMNACLTNATPSNAWAWSIKNRRPLVRFGYCPGYTANSFTYQWLPNNTAIFSAPTSTQTNVSPLSIAPQYSAVVIYSTVVTPTFINCPLTQQMTVTIFNPPTPTISAIPEMCNTFAPYTISVSPANAGGSFSGNNAVSPAGVITPSMASIGTNTVQYTIGTGSCIITVSTSFNVSQFNTAALTGSVAPMCHTFAPVNLMNLVQSAVNGTWSGTSVNSNSFIPLNLPTGIYTLTYNTTSSPNPTVCPDQSTLAIDVLNPPTPTITSAGPYCTNFAPQQIIVAPNTGTWLPHPALSPSGVFTPSLGNIGQNQLYYSIGTFTCLNTSVININVEQFVPATITGTIPDKCTNHSVVYLTPLAQSPLGTWSGPGVSNNVFDPSQSGTGAITLTYQTHSVPTTTLCPDQATLSVNVYSLAVPVIADAGPFCNTHAPYQLNVSPTGGTFYGSGVTGQGLFIPSSAAIGPHVVQYSITSGPCVEIATKTINVEKFVSANFMTYPGPFCKNDFPVNLESYVINPGGYFTGGNGLSGSVFTPSLANIGNNNIVIYHTHSSPTASLCPDTAAVRITVNDNPNPVIVSNTDKGCSPLVVLFSCSNYNTGTGNWYFGDGSNAIPGMAMTYTFTQPGSYNVTFEYSDEIGCKALVTLPTTITVYDVPKADFRYDPDGEISMLAPEVHFTNLSTILGYNNYAWKIGDLYTLTDVHPKVVFPQAGEYLITLTATNVHGCKDEISKLLVVKNDFGIYIPNSFTPNFDGINDVFRVYYTPFGIDPDTFEMEIFDRWGISLFRTKDINAGWDGTKGGKGDEPVKEGVYVYKVKYKDKEGKIYHKTGHVTLLK